MSDKVYITLEIDPKDSKAVIKSVGDESDKAFDKLKKGAKAGAASAQSSERAWSRSINNMKKHWVAYSAAAGVAIYGVTRLIRGAINEIGEWTAASNIQEGAERRLQAALTATGNACGYNIDQLKQMAGEMQNVTTVGDEVVISGQAILATFKSIKGDVFRDTMMAALDMTAAMNKGEVTSETLKGSMLQLGKALNDPTQGMAALTRVGVTFTDQQKEQIKHLQESGDLMGAQAIILHELQSEFGGTAAALTQDFNGAQIQAALALGDVKEELGFVITKNQFFIDIMHKARDIFVDWGSRIKDNREYLMSLTKDGLLSVVDGLTLGIKTLRFFHNAWLGIKLVGTASIQAIAIALDELYKGLRVIMKPLDLIFEGLKKMGTIDVNPFDKIEESLGTFRVSSADVTKDVLKDIEETNTSYNRIIGSIERWQDEIKNTAIQQATTSQKIIATEKKQTQNTLTMAKDYARESTRIYEQISKDVADMRGDTYEYEKKILDRQYKEYKKYAKDLNLLDEWYHGKLETLQDEHSRKYGSFLERMEVRWKDYQREGINANLIMYDAISAGAQNLEGQLSDNFFNILKGNMGDVKLEWDDMWNSMLKSASDYMAKIVTETALNTGAKAVGAGMDWLGTAMGWWEVGTWKVKKEQMSVLHPGEMVIPADMAEKIRGIAAGGRSTIGTQTELGEAFDFSSMEGMFADSFLSGMFGNLRSKTVGYSAMAATGKMGWGQALGAMVAGLPNALLAGFVQMVGDVAMDALGSLTGLRSDDATKSALESMLGGGIKGFALARQAYPAYMEMVLSEPGNLQYDDISSYMNALSTAWDKAQAISEALMNLGLNVEDYDALGRYLGPNMPSMQPDPIWSGWSDMMGDIFGGGGGADDGYGGSSGAHIGEGGTTAVGMKYGGIIDEHIIGRGQRSGRTYEFGEDGVKERVTPLNGNGGGGENHYHFHNHGIVTTEDVQAWFASIQRKSQKGRYGDRYQTKSIVEEGIAR